MSRKEINVCPDAKQSVDIASSYVPPMIVSYTSDEILEQIGPALACAPSVSCLPTG